MSGKSSWNCSAIPGSAACRRRHPRCGHRHGGRPLNAEPAWYVDAHPDIDAIFAASDNMAAGARVLPIEAPDGGILYVTDTSKPEIAEIVTGKNTGDDVTGKVTFSVGAPVTLTAPSASQVLNGSAIGL